MFHGTKAVLVTGGTFITGGRVNIQLNSNSGGGSSERKGTTLLHRHIADGAFHNSSERYDAPKCHPGTRKAILSRIMTWIRDRNHRRLFMWLYGPAGAGKSAIAQTIAELCQAEQLLLASFFFSCSAGGRRNTSRFLIATIAYQLAVAIPELMDHLATAVECDPLIFSRSLDSQILALIVAPLESAGISMTSGEAVLPRLMLFDGLDECGTPEMQQYVVEALTNAIDLIPIPILIVICSRPEYHIFEVFNAPKLRVITEGLALDDVYKPNDDIRAYLSSQFEEIRKRHPSKRYLSENWPSQNQVNTLVENSSGQFIYAATRLEDVLTLRSTAANDTPFEQLDALYRHVFASVDDLNTCLTILGFIILSADLKLDIHKSNLRVVYTPEEIEDFLGYERGTVLTMLVNLHSIIKFPDIELDPLPCSKTFQLAEDLDMNGEVEELKAYMDMLNTMDEKFFRDFFEKPAIHLHHTSLRDFLLDYSRSHQYFIDADSMQSNIAQRFMKDEIIRNHDPDSGTACWAGVVLSTVPKIIFFFAHCVCIRSRPSDEFIQELYHFSVKAQVNKIKTHYRYIYNFLEILTYWDNFLSWLKNQDLSYSGKSLYDRHLKEVDSWIQDMIAHYPEPLQSLLPAVIMLEHDHIWYMKTIFNILMVDLDPREIEETLDIDECSLCLRNFKISFHGHLQNEDGVNIEKGLSLLSRAGAELLGPERYLTLAQVFVNLLVAKKPQSNYCHMPHLQPTKQLLEDDSNFCDISDIVYWPHPHEVALILLPSILELAFKSPSMVPPLIQNITQFATTDDFHEERHGAAVAARKYINECENASWDHVHQPGYDFCVICENHTSGVNVLKNFTPPAFVAALDHPYTDDFETTLENIENELTLKHILGETLHGPYFYLTKEDHNDARSTVLNRRKTRS